MLAAYGYIPVSWCRLGERAWDPGLLRKVPVSETVQIRTPGTRHVWVSRSRSVFVVSYALCASKT